MLVIPAHHACPTCFRYHQPANMAGVEIFVDGREVVVTPETSVAAAVVQSGAEFFRMSVTGQPRGALCGMGICFECRVTVDDQLHVRSCQMLCRPGMRIVTG